MISKHVNWSVANGFTIIEVMMVLAIVGILSAFSLPAFNAWMADSQVKAASEHYMSGIRLAQAEAVKSGQRVEFFLTEVVPTAGAATSASGKNWGVQSMDLLNPNQVEELIQSAVISGQYSQITVNANTAVLAFNSIGRVANIAQNAQVDVTHPKSNDRLRILISTTGAMRLCNPDKSRTSSPDGC